MVRKNLNRTRYGNTTKQTRDAFKMLCELHNEDLQSPSQHSFQAVIESTNEWNHYVDIEEQLFKDQNTKFFHRAARSNALRNAIKCIKTESGENLTKLEVLKNEALNHFQFYFKF